MAAVASSASDKEKDQDKDDKKHLLFAGQMEADEWCPFCAKLEDDGATWWISSDIWFNHPELLDLSMIDEAWDTYHPHFQMLASHLEKMTLEELVKIPEAVRKALLS